MLYISWAVTTETPNYKMFRMIDYALSEVGVKLVFNPILPFEKQ